MEFATTFFWKVNIQGVNIVKDSSIIPGITRPGKRKAGDKAPRYAKLSSKEDLSKAIDGKWVAAKQILVELVLQATTSEAGSEPPSHHATTPAKVQAKQRQKRSTLWSVYEWFLNPKGQPIARYHTLPNGLVFWPQDPTKTPSSSKLP